MRPPLYRITAMACVLAGFLSTGCCGPMMFHGGCRSGCGELYVGPWISDPADCCDPCDPCAGGQQCGRRPNVLSGIKTIWGYRYPGGACGGDACGGCDSCGGCDAVAVEPTCGCDSPAVCDCALEPACGIEPGCGLEGCGGCSSCVGSRGFIEHPIMPSVPGESVMDFDLEASRVITPPNREMFRGGNVASGPRLRQY